MISRTRAHRISAHRALNLNPLVPKINERLALRGLRTGYPHEEGVIQHRIGSRWGSNASVSLLNDYDFLVQALFAEQANTCLVTHKNVRADTGEPASPTKFEELVDILDSILPHRKLDITGDNIHASVAGSSVKYSAFDMSDGERAIFILSVRRSRQLRTVSLSSTNQSFTSIVRLCRLSGMNLKPRGLIAVWFLSPTIFCCIATAKNMSCGITSRPPGGPSKLFPMTPTSPKKPRP
jgi:hypothetical protein